MPEIWILLLAFGATARLTRLITGDTITRPLRERIATRYGPDSMPAEFVTCPWCVGFWVALLVTALAFTPAVAGSRLFQFLCTALTISWLYALIAVNLDRVHHPPQ